MKRTILLLAVCFLDGQGQTPLRPRIVHQANASRPSVIHLAPRFATAIRMPDVVTSVVIGDPAKFLAEHSEKEPRLVLVKPTTEDIAESNLIVTTAGGAQATFALYSGGAGTREIDFVVEYTPLTSVWIPETREIGSTPRGVRSPIEQEIPAELETESILTLLLQGQKAAPLPTLYGERAPVSDNDGDSVKAGVSSVLEQDRELHVTFSAVNSSSGPVELLPPQVQLAARVSRGFPIRRSHWSASQQLPVKAYLLTPKRLLPGERADGVLIVYRPAFKQSNESLFLQVAQTGAVDKPALAPIPFGGTRAPERKTTHEKR